MKNGFLLLSLILTAFTLIFTSRGICQEKQEHQAIVESVEVNWWQVPIFALDNNGNPITDLKDRDFEIWLNNKRVEAFTFHKREFLVSEKKDTVTEAPKEAPPTLRNNTIFLLFDVSMSAVTCTNRSKVIAKQIITSAEPDIRFMVLTIEPFKGLNHVYGPGNDKDELVHKIEKKVIGKPNKRIANPGDFFGSGNLGNNTNRQRGGTPKRFSESDNSQLRELAGTYYLRKNRAYFNSFKTLYLLLNSMKDNKFVYFFTEGLPASIRAASMGGGTLYNFHLKKTADSLGRSGAVLFIVNPMGVRDLDGIITEKKDVNSIAAGNNTSYFDREKSLSGEESLRFLANESGGKYLEGVNREIVQTLEHMHHAYYEISFPDIPGLEGDIRTIKIKPKRSNLFIHSLRSLEKNKPYKEMSRIEKEIVAVNLISQNPLMKSTLSRENARIIDTQKDKTHIVYRVLLPEEFLNQQLDLYKFRVKDNEEVINLETEFLVPEKREISIRFESKARESPTVKPCFALVNANTGTALVLALK